MTLQEPEILLSLREAVRVLSIAAVVERNATTRARIERGLVDLAIDRGALLLLPPRLHGLAGRVLAGKAACPECGRG